MKVAEYVRYMGSGDVGLQPRKVQGKYEFWETNRPRNKTQECIWNDVDLQTKVKSYLIQKYDYYKFCLECMGNKDQLPL